MNCQILFSGKIIFKYKYFKILSAEISVSCSALNTLAVVRCKGLLYLQKGRGVR